MSGNTLLLRRSAPMALSSSILTIHLIATAAKLLLPGGARSIISESLLLKHQLLILNRSRARAPNLRRLDRVIASLCAGLMRPARLLRSAIVLKPSTLMALHRALVKRKYRLLFTPRRRRKSGPKGPSPELIAAIVEMKRRNPRFGCRRIAQQISFVFGVEIDKDVVRRVLARGYRTLLAHLPQAHQRQSLERRSLSLRVTNPQDPLGHGRDGSVHPPHHRLRLATRRGRWLGPLPNVQSGDRRHTLTAAIPQQRPRSAI